MFNPGKRRPTPDATTLSLIFRSISVILTHFVPIYGVVHLGWDSFGLVFLFILEGVLVLLTDSIKVLFLRKNHYPQIPLVMEICFILFFGFFAILVYGPYESLEQLIADRLRLLTELIVGEYRLPLLTIAFFRFVRLLQDLFSQAALKGLGKQAIHLDGGSWAFLLFLAVIVAPVVARTGPNPMGGLIVLVLLKMGGELVFVWFSRIQ
jgi:hypothetical protein